MSSTSQDWFKCELDRKTLKQLSKRTDRHGLIHIGSYFVILILFAVALIATWGTVWAVPVFILYSTLWSFGNAAGHEACHGTPFRSQYLNDGLLIITAWMENWEPITVRWVHARHHTYTSNVENDAEYLLPNAVKWKDMLGLLTGWNQIWHYNKELIQLASGYANPFIKVSVPDTEMPKVFRNARVYLASYLAVAVVAVWMQTWLPLFLLIFPRIAGAPMHGILRIAQHGALATEIKDHRKTTRTMYVNPVLQFFYCNMNYHIEHHMYPMVPFHALKALHDIVKDQMPTPTLGVTGAMREVFITMKRQRENPGYVWDNKLST